MPFKQRLAGPGRQRQLQAKPTRGARAGAPPRPPPAPPGPRHPPPPSSGTVRSRSRLSIFFRYWYTRFSFSWAVSASSSAYSSCVWAGSSPASPPAAIASHGRCLEAWRFSAAHSAAPAAPGRDTAAETEHKAQSTDTQ